MSVAKIAVGSLTHGMPRIEFVAGLERLQEYEMSKPFELRHWHTHHWKVGPYISRNRNYLTKLFLGLEDRPEWLLMIDHDVLVAHDLMEQLARAGAADESAGVIIPDHVLGTSCPTTALIEDKRPGREGYYMAAEQPAEGDRHYVDTAASSVIMVRRRVFEKIASISPSAIAFGVDVPRMGPGSYWMHHQTIVDGAWEELGEDFSFSKRAIAVGERILAVYGLDVQHYKVGRVMGAPANAGGK